MKTITPPLTRREFLRRSGAGFGMLGLADLLGTQTANAASTQGTHFAPKAKRVIQFFSTAARRKWTPSIRSPRC